MKSPPIIGILLVALVAVVGGFPSVGEQITSNVGSRDAGADVVSRTKRNIEDVVKEKNRLVEEKSRQVISEDIRGTTLQEATRLLSSTETQDPPVAAALTASVDPHVANKPRKYDPSGLNPNIQVSIEFLHERKNSSSADEPSPIIPRSSDRLWTPTTPANDVADDEDEDSDLWVKVDIGEHAPPETDANVNRHHAPWSKWSPCSATCGQGFQFRHRNCGPDCTETAKRECRRKPCPLEEGEDYDFLKNSDAWSSLNNPALAPLLLSLQQVMAGFQGWDMPGNVDASQGNACERWLKCPADDALRELTGVDELPACPCTYSTELSSSDGDGRVRWRDVSWKDGKLDIYNSGAARCIRSVPALSSSVGRHKWTGLSVQNCCYDSSNALLTRGSGAGTPHCVSADVSSSLHRFVDILPWLACKGDFTRFHARRKPNNGNSCPKNPDDATFEKQVHAATTF